MAAASRFGSTLKSPSANFGTSRPAFSKRSRVARLFLAAAAASGGWPGSPSARITPRGDDGRTVADGEHAVQRSFRRRGQNVGHRSVFVVEANRDGVVAPGIVQLMTAIRRKHQIDRQRLRCLRERPRLISRRRRKKKDARHGILVGFGFGFGWLCNVA